MKRLTISEGKTMKANLTASGASRLLAAPMLIFTAFTSPVNAALPVTDASNLSQNVITAMENVAHTAKQIQQYQTQLQQYQNMLQNTARPNDQIWDAATTTMNQLRKSTDILNHYKATLGSVDAYLEKFQDTEGYRNSPCYSVRGCTAEQWASMNEAERYGSQSQKKATDALFRGLDLQQKNLQVDATQLQRLQSSAGSAAGQMQALGYANQLASHQANQLLQIRALLMAQQAAIATRNQALADREAKQLASAQAIRVGTFKRTASTTYR